MVKFYNIFCRSRPQVTYSIHVFFKYKPKLRFRSIAFWEDKLLPSLQSFCQHTVGLDNVQIHCYCRKRRYFSVEDTRNRYSCAVVFVVLIYDCSEYA